MSDVRTLPEVPWFESTARRNFEKFLLPLAYIDRLDCLQIGVFTGAASVWMMENLPGAHLVDVDPFTGSEGIERFDYIQVRQAYADATAHYRQRGRITTWMMTSEQYFKGAGRMFDFVYIDGDHVAPVVLSDAVHSFGRLHPGGMIAFDDYFWDANHGEMHNPKLAIDAFCAIYAEQIEVLEVGPQVWVRRRM